MQPTKAVGKLVGSFDGLPGEEETRGHYHWSIPTLAATSVVGTIVTVAALVLGEFAIAFLSAMLAFSGAVGSYYIHRFFVLNSLDDYNEQLRAQTKREASQISELQKKISKLEEILKKYTLLEKNHQKSLQEERDKTSEKIEEIKRLSKRLKNLFPNIEKVQTDFGSIAVNIQKFASENTIFKQHLERLGVDIHSILEAKEKLLEGARELDDETEEYDHLNHIFQMQLQLLQALFTHLVENEKKEESQLGMARRAVEGLKPLVDELKESGESLHETADAFEQLLPAMREMLLLRQLKKDPEKWQIIEALLRGEDVVGS